MSLAFYIARKYFFSGQVNGVVHIISAVSLVAITVVTAAFIVVMSVINGMEDLVISLYETFDSDLKIESKEGKYFRLEEQQLGALANIDGIRGLSPIIEENALAKFDDQQTIARLRGMTPDYFMNTGMDTTVFLGEPFLDLEGMPLAATGSGVAAKLELSVYSEFKQLHLFVPKKRAKYSANPNKVFKRSSIAPGGIFSVQKEFDDKFIIVPLEFAQQIVGDTLGYTAYEMNVKPGADLSEIKEKVAAIIGSERKLLDRLEQHDFVYKIIRSEKFSSGLIISFVLLIAAFNLIGALIMLALDKKKDLAVLGSLGARVSTISYIIMLEGLILSIGGALAGLLIGGGICWLQIQFGFVKLGGGSFVADAYPVALRFTDFVWVFLIVAGLGIITAALPAWRTRHIISYRDLQTR